MTCLLLRSNLLTEERQDQNGIDILKLIRNQGILGVQDRASSDILAVDLFNILWTKIGGCLEDAILNTAGAEAADIVMVLGLGAVGMGAITVSASFVLFSCAFEKRRSS